jgi:hypothetical protein
MVRLQSFVALAVSISLAGCKPAEQAINDAFYHGTLAGAEKCIELKATTLVSADNVKQACVEQFEDTAPSSVRHNIEGRGRPELFFNTKVFSANLENKNRDFVITEIEIEIQRLDKNGGVEKRYYARRSIWLEPGERGFSFQSEEVQNAPDDWKSMNDCEGCWTWFVSSAKGLSL